MVNKKKNLEKANRVKEIAKKYNLVESEKELEEFIINNNEYKAHIVMIGGYSAGKSALLNRYIGKPVLKEAQVAETDIAAELYFSEDEHIEANLLDGTKKKITVDEKINIDEVRNVEYYINSENIKTQCDYIMVDTPGFDSGIEKHNKALIQYIDRGTAFIVVVDCEKGTVSESTLNFINEILNYSDDIAVILNKCDKKIPEEAKKVKEHIEEVLLAATGENFPIVCTSIYDDDVEEKMKQVIGTFNPEYLYEKNITKDLENKCLAIIDALNIVKDNVECDTKQIDEEILKREKAREKLLAQIDVQKEKVGRKLHSDVKEKIISKVNSQLLSNVSVLAQAYQGGINTFQEKIIEIVRPILISELEEYSSATSEDFIKGLDYGCLKQEKNTEDISSILQNVYLKIKDANFSERLDVPTEFKTGWVEENESGRTAYRAISSVLAIVTDVIAPPLELLIVFLPDIVKLVGVLTGTTKEEKLVEAIRNQIIPQIVSKLRESIDKSLSDVENIMIQNIEENIGEILNIENDALESARKKKEEKQYDYEEYIKEIERDIENIRK